MKNTIKSLSKIIFLLVFILYIPNFEMPMFARHFNHYCRSDYIEEEASLSGDDVGSDDDEDEGPDEYEEEEGDKEDLPDAETIREQLHKQWLKQQQVWFF